MKKILLAVMAVITIGLFCSPACACWPEKKTILLKPYALDIARTYCMHEAKNPKVAYAEQLRFGEMAEMIEEGQITYNKSFNPRFWLHASKVWHLYNDGIELEKKLKKEAAVKAWRIKKIKQEVRLKAKRKTT